MVPVPDHKRSVLRLSMLHFKNTFKGVHPSESSETISVKISNSKEDVSTYFNDGQRKVDFVLVSQEMAGASGSEGATAVTAAAQAFK